MKNLAVLLLLTSSFTIPAWAESSPKGLMPEIKLDKDNEDSNASKAVQSEVLIAKTEAKAISALQSVLKKKKGSPQEPDLWNRLAELYMRRAKSGRFFDLNRGDEKSPIRFAPVDVREESAVANLKLAISIYDKIEREFPVYADLDSVLFNNAFASQQIGKRQQAENLFARMIEKFPKSSLIADAHLAYGELLYDQQKFDNALGQFKSIEKYKGARVYSYGLYKQAWTHYNLQNNDAAIEKLIQVVKFWDPTKSDLPRGSHNLRSEALRDLALFFGETRPADEAYGFFAKLCQGNELGETLIAMGKLYESHSRNKELNIFLEDYTRQNPDSSLRIRAEMLLMTSYENLKDRKNVVKHVLAANELCSPSSSWRQKFTAQSEGDCDYDLARATVDIAKKWWDLWLKNKKNLEMAALTEQAFQIHLSRENPEKPDTKSHYAYAELLFQLGKFRQASEQYHLTSQKSADTQIAHDASYSAIVSLQKAQEQKAESTDKAQSLELCQNYLKRFPKGSQAQQVQYKLGFLAYDQKDYELAEKHLAPLAESSQDKDLAQRSQDLLLDIFNAKGDLTAVHSFSKKILVSTTEPERKKSLQKIMQEAGYASIQKGLQQDTPEVGVQKLVVFSKENADSPIAKEALWQAVALAFAKKQIMTGADLATQFATTYPTDSRAAQGLRDAAKHYNEQGFITKAALALQQLAPSTKTDEQTKITEAVAEAYALEGKKREAREFYQRLIVTADKAQIGSLYTKLLSTYTGEESSSEFQKLEAKVLALNIEPCASEIQIRRLQSLFDQKKLMEAFQTAKSLVGSQAPPRIRAQARMIQARVLEAELVGQSTKTSLDRLSLVLSIKTEKLDKSQQGFLAAASYSKDPDIQLAMLEGLARIYKNYVETVGNPVIKSPMSPAERTALDVELAKLVEPIQKKQADITSKLKSFAKAEKTTSTLTVDFASLPLTETAKPQISPIQPGQLNPYLPRITQVEGLFVERNLVVSVPTLCRRLAPTEQVSLTDLVNLTNSCFNLGKKLEFEAAVVHLAQLEPDSGFAPYYLSLEARKSGLHDKALYLIELALQKNKDKAMFWYQKALTLADHQDMVAAHQFMIKAFDERLDAWETKLIHGSVAFSQGDCFSVTDDFQQLSEDSRKLFHLEPALSECMAQKGEVDSALSYIQREFSKQKTLALALQWGHLAEIYKNDTSLAATAYQAALKQSQDPVTQDWLKNKIKWLQNPSSVSSTDSLHVDSTVARGEGLRGGL